MFYTSKFTITMTLINLVFTGHVLASDNAIGEKSLAAAVSTSPPKHYLHSRDQNSPRSPRTTTEVSESFWTATIQNTSLNDEEKRTQGTNHYNQRLERYKNFLRTIEEARYQEILKDTPEALKFVQEISQFFQRKIDSLKYKFSIFNKNIILYKETQKLLDNGSHYQGKLKNLARERSAYALVPKAETYKAYADFIKLYPPQRPESAIDFNHEVYRRLQDFNIILDSISDDSKQLRKQGKELKKSIEKMIKEYCKEDSSLYLFFKSQKTKWRKRAETQEITNFIQKRQSFLHYICSVSHESGSDSDEGDSATDKEKAQKDVNTEANSSSEEDMENDILKISSD